VPTVGWPAKGISYSGQKIRIRRQHENGFRQVELARDRLHPRGVETLGVEHDSQRIAFQRRAGEDVEQHIAASGHHGLHHPMPIHSPAANRRSIELRGKTQSPACGRARKMNQI
jgi:hypothetical protein